MQNELWLNELDDTARKSETLLNQAEDQQAATAQLLSEVDRANEKAKDALKRGNQTLIEAQETLKKLGGKYILADFVYRNRHIWIVFKWKVQFIEKSCESGTHGRSESSITAVNNEKATMIYS